MHTHFLAAITAVALASALLAAPQRTPAHRQPLPRMADGKPNFQGIWQASSTAGADLQDHAARYNMLAGRSVVVGGEIPYLQWAAAKKAENFQNRQKADPLTSCYMAGVPRMMYLDLSLGPSDGRFGQVMVPLLRGQRMVPSRANRVSIATIRRQDP
jgi:hypothetical protein